MSSCAMMKNKFSDVKRPVISSIDCAAILKDLSREVKNAERISLKVLLTRYDKWGRIL